MGKKKLDKGNFAVRISEKNEAQMLICKTNKYLCPGVSKEI